MSTSRHPVALRLESIVGNDARLLALVMGLPLVDGIFVALILSGALDTVVGAVQVGLLIFGGSATVAVILADMTGTPREQAGVVLLVGIPLIALAAIQAALAPAIESVLDIAIFERFAALVIMAVAAKTASATIGDYLPSSAVIIALGLVASLDPSGAEFAVLHDTGLVVNATAAAVVAVTFALALALSGPYLRAYVDLDRFRFGSAVALGLLPLAVLGMPFGNAPLAVLAVSALFAFDPGDVGDVDLGEAVSGAFGSRETTDGGSPEKTEMGADGGSGESGAIDEAYPGGDSGEERAPWL